MKNQFQFTKIMLWPGLQTALAGLMLLGIAVSSLAAEPDVVPPSSLPFGYSYEEWSAKYWQWTLGQSTSDVEDLGNPNICGGSGSRVRFLGPSTIGGEEIQITTNRLTIPAKTPLFFSIFALWQDNGNCPLSAFTTFTAAQLAAFDQESWNAVTETSCTIDGVAVEGMDEPTNSVYNVVSTPFSYTTAGKDNVLAGKLGATCVPANFTIYPAVADGMYLMLSPFSPGKHTIHAVAVVGPLSAPFAKSDKTIEITVDP